MTDDNSGHSKPQTDNNDDWHIIEKFLIGFSLGALLLLKSGTYGIYYAVGYSLVPSIFLIGLYFLTRRRPRYISIGLLLLMIIAIGYFVSHPNLLNFSR